MPPSPTPTPTRRQESAAERWERWRATQPTDRRRVLTRSEQRRLAQKASVKTRRRSAALRAQAEAEPREQVRKGRAFLNARLPHVTTPPADPLPPPTTWPRAPYEYGRYLRSPANPVFVHTAALRLFRALHGGRDPVWVRKWHITFTHFSPAL